LVPGATRIGLVDDVTDPKAHPQRLEIEPTGRSLAIKVVSAEVRTAADIGPAYEALAAGGVEVIVVEQTTLLGGARRQIGAAAAKKVATDSSLYAPRTGGAYDSHHQTAGIAGRTRRSGRVAARGARAAVGENIHHRYPSD